MSDGLGKTVRLMAIIMARCQNREPEDWAGLEWSQQASRKFRNQCGFSRGRSGWRLSRAVKGSTMIEAGVEVLVCREASTKVSGTLSPAG